MDFYPRSPCGERRKPTALHLAGAPISIHALLAESDYSTSSSGCACSNFYPRSPCGERLSNNSRHYFRPHFYPRSPCGERHRRSEKYPAGRHFYPRSPCGERHTGQPVRGLPSYFYPRSPCGERPRKVFSAYGGYPISIHALLAESDHWEYWVGGYGTAFLSTLSLRRATPDPVTGHWPHWVFLSTLSLRRATTAANEAATTANISIHALLAESDRHGVGIAEIDLAFLSTLSLRRATHTGGTGNNRGCDFYPRSPCGERRPAA